jgi:Tfp pilus assembly protein PilF
MFGAPRLALAKTALDEAESIDPEHVEVHKALALYYSWTGETEQMEEYATAVIRQQPNDPWALMTGSYFQLQRGDFDSAEVLMLRAGELDPRSPQAAGEISDLYANAGRYEDALTFADRRVSLAADQPRPYIRKAWLHMLAGDTAATKEALQLGIERVGLVNVMLEAARGTPTVRIFRIFDEYGEVMRGLSQDAFGTDTLDYLLAKANSYHASPDLARAYFDSLVVLRTAYLQANPDIPLARAGRALAYAGVGQRDAAMQDVDSVLRMPARSSRAWFIAEAFVMLGEYDAAIEQLRNLMSWRSQFSPSVLRLDPIWDPLRGHPGFQELLEGGE